MHLQFHTYDIILHRRPLVRLVQSNQSNLSSSCAQRATVTPNNIIHTLLRGELHIFTFKLSADNLKYKIENYVTDVTSCLLSLCVSQPPAARAVIGRFRLWASRLRAPSLQPRATASVRTTSRSTCRQRRDGWFDAYCCPALFVLRPDSEYCSYLLSQINSSINFITPSCNWGFFHSVGHDVEVELHCCGE